MKLSNKLSYFTVLLKFHFGAIILALFFSVLIFLPTARSIAGIGLEKFKGVYPIITDDDEYYLARTQEVIDGHPNLGSPYLNEYKSLPYMSPPLAEIIFAKTSQAFHLSVPALFAILDFLMPLITFLFLYFFFYKFTFSRILANLLTFTFCFICSRELSRVINQQFSFLLYVCGMYAVWNVYINQKRLNSIFWNVLLAIVFGALVYIYPFFWTTLLAVYVAVLALKFYLQRDFRVIFYNLLVFLTVTLILCWPYLYNLLGAQKNANYADTVSRIGVINTFWPASYFGALIILLSMTLLWLIRKRVIEKNYFYFSWILLTTALLVNWQNVFTGKYLWISSHYRVPLIFLVFLAIALNLRYFKINILASKINRFLAPVILAIIFILLIRSDWSGIMSALRFRLEPQSMSRLQQMSDVYNWLNKYTPIDSVLYVAGQEGYWNIYPIYTHNNLYFTFMDSAVLVSNQELERRWIRNNLLNDWFDEKYLYDHPTSPSIMFVPAYQNEQTRQKLLALVTRREYQAPPMIPMAYLDHEVALYRQAKTEGLERSLKDFKIDYIIIDNSLPSNKKTTENIKQLPFVSFLIEINQVLIFKVN